ncbi:MAG: ATP-grasp domain-containing protein [Bacillota bacterium]
MRVLLYEHFSAQAAGCDVSLAAEGRAMLTAVLEDLSLCPGVLPSAFVNHGIPLPGHLEPARLAPAGTVEAFRSQVRLSDACLFIAPETGQILENLTIIAEAEGKPLLGASSLGVRLAGDKMTALGLLSRRLIPVPRTRWFPRDAGPGEVRSFGLPAVIKPVDGAGCVDTFLVLEESQIGPVLARIRAAPPHRRFILQEYLAGIAASVSCLVTPGEGSTEPACTPLSLNRQLVFPEGAGLRYRGVRVPLVCSMAQEAFRLGLESCAAIPGLRGWVGIDMVITQGGPVVIEVNPRLTDAYVALKRATRVNLASMILAVCLEGVKASPPRVEGEAEYEVDVL